MEHNLWSGFNIHEIHIWILNLAQVRYALLNFGRYPNLHPKLLFNLRPFYIWCYIFVYYVFLVTCGWWSKGNIFKFKDDQQRLTVTCWWLLNARQRRWTVGRQLYTAHLFSFLVAPFTSPSQAERAQTTLYIDGEQFLTLWTLIRYFHLTILGILLEIWINL